MCLRPIEIHTKKAGEINSRLVKVPCGWCAECISAKSTAWAIRLKEEERYCKNAYFITLTYSDDMIPMFNPGTGEFKRGEKDSEFYPILYKHDVQKLIKRYRKADNPKNFKYYAVGEYGSKTYRPHYHLIVFNCNVNKLLEKWRINGEVMGITHAGNVTPASIRYVTNYVMNKRKYSSRKMFPEFSIMSKGLGKDYIERMKYWHRNTNKDVYSLGDGLTVILPRYYKERIFDDITRQVLAEKNRINAEFELQDKSAYMVNENHKYKTIMLNRSKKSRKN